MIGFGSMTEIISDDIKKDLHRACTLHQRATSDYAQCEAFSKLMCDLLSRLEDAGCFDVADKVMKVLLDCNPKIGSHCEKATGVSKVMKKLDGIILTDPAHFDG
ncbi:conserved hypothetical protein [Desulforapulum autotrophicum HRM2]|uniref:Uncharacterized protein n=2 Tax=Desulforapulum autotrophicum TaxID=2296 RepID=C0QII4_DESAH|nr:conserved hypothetical protein [Desulforapulum autotrophicum HRM2]